MDNSYCVFVSSNVGASTAAGLSNIPASHGIPAPAPAPLATRAADTRAFFSQSLLVDVVQSLLVDVVEPSMICTFSGGVGFSVAA